MIRLTCTNCKNVLEMDDAFAGGACRCVHCRTIQTVPKHLKGNGGPGPSTSTAVAELGSSQTLFQNVSQRSGLEALADVVGSSGISSGRLAKTPEGLPPPPDDPLRRAARSAPSHRPKPSPGGSLGLGGIVVVLGVVIAVLAGVIVVLVTRGGGGKPALTSAATKPANAVLPRPKPPTAPSDTKADQAQREARAAATEFARRIATAAKTDPSPPAKVNGGAPDKPKPTVTPPKPVNGGVPSGPQFGGVKIDEPSVVFVLDRGSDMGESFTALKQASLKSIRSLRPQQKFQLVFCGGANGTGEKSLPAGGPVEATKENIEKVERELAGVTSQKDTNVRETVLRAFGRKPAAVVVVSAKGHQPDTVDSVLSARGGSGTKIYCFSVARPAVEPALKLLAERTGGQYRSFTRDELKSFGQ